MFQNLSNRFSELFKNLTSKGLLTEADVDAAMREVRVALLEADVALPVVKQFVQAVREKAVGQEVIRSVSPGQMVIKIVHDQLVEMLSGGDAELNLSANPPVVIMMVGLQGSGKTTSTGKIALRLKDKHRKKVMLASLDVQRPAAQEQLEVLARQTDVLALPIIKGESPVTITKRAMNEARLNGVDVLILDTAGRLHVDEELMQELADVHAIANPHEVLLVADSLTGQDAVNVATSFQARIPLSGIVLTRVDGDARGGAALSMRSVTGCPIKFMGVGEKITELEPFHAERIAGRILDKGDVVSLVERAAETIDKDEAEAMAKKLQAGEFTLDDLAKQLRQMKKMGGISSMLGMMPGMGALKQKMGEVNVDDRMLLRQEAIISSMTLKERNKPDILNASRRKRIAAGAGVQVQDVNRLLKQHRQMSDMVKQMKKLGAKGMMKQLAQLQKMGGQF